MRKATYISPINLEIFQMKEEGKSYKEISKITGISEVNLWNIIRDIGIELKPPVKKCRDCGVRVTKQNKPATRSNRCRKCFNKYHNEKFNKRKF